MSTDAKSRVSVDEASAAYRAATRNLAALEREIEVLSERREEMLRMIEAERDAVAAAKKALLAAALEN